MPTPMHISLRDYGSYLSSRGMAAELREQITAPVTLDFSGVHSVSWSYADELYAVLVEQRGEQWVRDNVQVTGLDEHCRKVMLEAVESRMRRGKKGQQESLS